MTRLSFVRCIGLALLLAACTTDAWRGGKIEGVDAMQMAASFRRSGDNDAAIAVLREAVAKAPEDTEARTQLGYALILSGQFKEAVEQFDKVIELKPKNARAYDGKAVAFDHAGNHLAAQELYQQALALAPNTLSIENNLAMSLLLNGQLDGAVELFEKLSGSHSDNSTVRHNLAMAYALTGEKNKAYALNLEDLSPEEASENMRYYEEWQRRHRIFAKRNAPIGFADTPAPVAAQMEKAFAKAAKRRGKIKHAAAPEKDKEATTSSNSWIQYTYPSQNRSSLSP